MCNSLVGYHESMLLLHSVWFCLQWSVHFFVRRRDESRDIRAGRVDEVVGRALLVSITMIFEDWCVNDTLRRDEKQATLKRRFVLIKPTALISRSISNVIIPVRVSRIAMSENAENSTSRGLVWQI